MKRVLLLSLAVLAVVSYTEAKSQGTHKYDGSISFDLFGNSSVQRQHALNILWKAVQDAFGKANGISSQGEGDHNGSGRISGTVNFAGERERGDKDKNTTSTAIKKVEVQELEGESVEEIVTFEDNA
ncbi:uncharacterized protein LOC100119225 [Nasonia vitripennis]|uniref:Uncharacterized protein n=1 Tax=Nasonia vitripennis TaxID=7425 RepID=A0A7M7T6J2_NASVI|nr:uncharacterized protein LOC100119225 [Nasonia vitripennis]XP_031777883.1 uncharacterized protein LOC100119225 [Nasonia vitripennis]